MQPLSIRSSTWDREEGVLVDTPARLSVTGRSHGPAGARYLGVGEVTGSRAGPEVDPHVAEDAPTNGIMLHQHDPKAMIDE